MDAVQRVIRASAIDLVTKSLDTGDRTRLDSRIASLTANIDRIGDRPDPRARRTVAENRFELHVIEAELAALEKWEDPETDLTSSDGGE